MTFATILLHASLTLTSSSGSLGAPMYSRLQHSRLQSPRTSVRLVGNLHERFNVMAFDRVLELRLRLAEAVPFVIARKTKTTLQEITNVSLVDIKILHKRLTLARSRISKLMMHNGLTAYVLQFLFREAVKQADERPRDVFTSNVRVGHTPAPYRIDSPGPRPRGETWWFGEFRWKTSPLPLLEELQSACFIIAEGSGRNLFLCASPMGEDCTENSAYSAYYGQPIYLCPA